MSENGLAVRQNNTGITPAEEWRAMTEQADMLVKSGFLPDSVKTPAQALAIMMTGKELGLPPMQSIRGITVIKGTPSMKPETMLALCISRVPGFRYDWGECSVKSATVTVSRPSMATPFVSTFTWDDAVAAGLTVTTYKEGGKGENKMWKAYPANMLRWRALGNALHVCCPDVLVGIYTPEELGADVNADGEIIDTQQAAPRAQEPRSAPIPAEPVEDAQFAMTTPEPAPSGALSTPDQITAIKRFASLPPWGKSKTAEFRSFCNDAAGATFSNPAQLTHDQALLVIEALAAAENTAARDAAGEPDPFEGE